MNGLALRGTCSSFPAGSVEMVLKTVLWQGCEDFSLGELYT